MTLTYLQKGHVQQGNLEELTRESWALSRQHLGQGREGRLKFSIITRAGSWLVSTCPSFDPFLYYMLDQPLTDHKATISVTQDQEQGVLCRWLSIGDSPTVNLIIIRVLESIGFLEIVNRSLSPEVWSSLSILRKPSFCTGTRTRLW